MILSVSRRTDVPAFYSNWFVNRLKAGFLLIPYPRNAHRLGRVELSPEIVDCIVFWSKNPKPIFRNLETIRSMGYPFYFQFTLTPYGRDVETNLPPKTELLKTFRTLSERIGPERMVWRYDPIILNENFTTAYHLDRFAAFCKELHGFTNRCVFSFFGGYEHLLQKFPEIAADKRLELAPRLVKIATAHDMSLRSCAENLDLSPFGIEHSSCIDREMIETILGLPIQAARDKGQRPACRCIESVDVGVYDSCDHDCRYCYATTSRVRVEKNKAIHDPNSPILIGVPHGDEPISNRTTPSLKIRQGMLF